MAWTETREHIYYHTCTRSPTLSVCITCCGLWLEMMHGYAIDTRTLLDFTDNFPSSYEQLFLEVTEDMYWKILS